MVGTTATVLSVILLIVVVSFVLALPILRQSDRIILSEKELKSSLEEIYRNVHGEIFVHAGEANVETYSQLKDVIEDFLKDKENKIIFVVGPVLSVYDTVFSKYSRENIGDIHELKDVHPLFELLYKYPNQVRVYYKKNNFYEKVNHFAIGGNYLYIEPRHKPLKERVAILIKNPIFTLKKHYENLRDKILTDRENIAVLQLDDLNKANIHDKNDKIRIKISSDFKKVASISL